jgi:hypothetical protein
MFVLLLTVSITYILIRCLIYVMDTVVAVKLLHVQLNKSPSRWEPIYWRRRLPCTVLVLLKIEIYTAETITACYKFRCSSAKGELDLTSLQKTDHNGMPQIQSHSVCSEIYTALQNTCVTFQVSLCWRWDLYSLLHWCATIQVSLAIVSAMTHN